VAGYSQRDDFLGLLPAAPLWLRWRLLDELQTVQAGQPQAPGERQG
jgi:hypothetical protein